MADRAVASSAVQAAEGAAADVSEVYISSSCNNYSTRSSSGANRGSNNTSSREGSISTGSWTAGRLPPLLLEGTAVYIYSRGRSLRHNDTGGGTVAVAVTHAQTSEVERLALGVPEAPATANVVDQAVATNAVQAAKGYQRH